MHERLQELPVELLCTILSAIDDLPSLLSAILASRTLHDAFAGAKRTVLSGVLANHVGVHLLPYAFAAVNTIDTTRPGWETFLVDPAPAPVPHLLTTDHVASVARLCALVRAFVPRFVQRATAARPDILRSPLPMSGSEVTRIERAFYRFEAFRNLYATLPRTFLNRAIRCETVDACFAPLAPWEAEQLGCIHDFLFHQIEPAFNDVASHDIEWGSRYIAPALDYESPYIQAIMSKGLASIYSIATANTYAERHKALCQWSPGTHLEFLFRALRHRGHGPVGLLQESPGAPYVPRRGQDCDRGPQDAWEWAYADCAPRVSVYKLDRTELRRWGYVLWDRARLDAISLFKESFCPSRFLDVSERRVVDDEFAASWRAREKISEAGGAGYWCYWSKADQCQNDHTVPRRRANRARGTSRGGRTRGRPSGGQTRAEAKRALEEESARVGAAMERMKMRTTNETREARE